jgi:hypothetical protein
MYRPEPLDIVVVDGHPYNPLHLAIIWRGLDMGSHCLTVKNIDGAVWSPQAGGILDKKLSDYAGRDITVHRYQGEVDCERLWIWGYAKQDTCKGYDFTAWMGFATGLKSLSNDEERWTCAEFPYWMFHGNGYTLTPNDESFIYPRFFRFNPLFREVWKGRI